MNERVTGIGGVFFKAREPEELRAWYARHLGIAVQDWGGTAFEWRERNQPDRIGSTVWTIFPDTSQYFDPSTAPFMINYRVRDLDQLLAVLRQEGVEVDKRREDSEFGRFAWVHDPEGNRIELWEPPAR